MPEGDTIKKAALALDELLRDRVLLEVRSMHRPTHPSLVGRTVVGVDALGKHTLIGIDEGTTIRVHLRMTGQWHRYDPGERWRLRRDRATLVLSTAEDVVVCFDALDVEFLSRLDLARHGALTRLGPDLLGPEPNFAAIVARAREREDRELGEVLLDQTVAPGIGNVVKSEVCFLCRVSPRARLSGIDDGALETVYRTARQVLEDNVRPGPRTTTPQAVLGGPRLFVYERAGRACLVCGAVITAYRQGVGARATFECEGCQRR